MPSSGSDSVEQRVGPWFLVTVLLCVCVCVFLKYFLELAPSYVSRARCVDVLSHDLTV